MKRPTRGSPRSLAPFALPLKHTLLGPVLADVFREIGIAASVTDGKRWYPLNVLPTVVSFERPLGREKARDRYNKEAFRKIHGKKELFVGEHAGFCDLFAPIADGNRIWGMLATGPFTTARATSADIRTRWRRLSGQNGRLSDPAFAHYVTTTLGTLVLEGEMLDAFRGLMSILSRLLSGVDSTSTLAQEAAPLRKKLDETRYLEKMWTGVAEMIDPRSSRAWSSSHMLPALAELGLSIMPERIAVGLLVAARGSGDPIDDLVRRDAFVRAGVAHVRRRAGVALGRVGNHGVVLVQGQVGAATRLLPRLLETIAQLTALGRQFGFKLHFGVSAGGRSMLLPTRYQVALAAAERALSQSAAIVEAEPERELGRQLWRLRDLRRQLVQATRQDPSTLPARFDGYLEAVVAHGGYRLEATRANLETGFDDVADVLVLTGVISERDALEQKEALDAAVGEAETVEDVCSAHRRIVADLAAAVSRPSEARHERSIRRAVAYIAEYFGEPLSLGKVATVAGFAPAYFCKLFARSEGETFNAYLTRVRLEHAQQMLRSTPLSVERVGQLCGFRTRNHFHRAFKRSLRATPNEYRQRMG